MRVLECLGVSASMFEVACRDCQEFRTCKLNFRPSLTSGRVVFSLLLKRIKRWLSLSLCLRMALAGLRFGGLEFRASGVRF